MKQLNKMSALFCFFLGIAVLMKGVYLGLKTNLEIGPGFFPFVAGGILAFLSVVLVIQSFIDPGISEYKKSFWINSHGLKRVFFTLLAISAYPLILDRLGFLLTTFFLLFFLFRMIARLKWRVVVAGGTLTTVIAYLIFEIWLKANLPQGYLGF